jgi:hypothetical protein
MKRIDIPQSQWGRIVSGGMGGFLNPPTHPEHYRSVKSYQGNHFFMSLSFATECERLDDETRNGAAVILSNWVKPSINDEPVQDWIYRVLGYFHNCYSIDGKDRDVNNCLIWIEKDKKSFGDKWKNFQRNRNRHIGVMFIREFYPEYMPTDDDFHNAYWGTKKAG